MSSRKKPRTAAAPSKIDPGPRTKKAIAHAVTAFEDRPARAYMRWEVGPDGALGPGSPHSDEVGHVAQLMDALGTTSSGFLSRNLGYLEGATRDRHENRGQSDAAFNAGLALVQAVDPQNELEAVLAIQIAGNHALSMEMLSRAKSTDRTDHIELYGNMAVKLQRTFAAQLEALARLRGKGQQTVRVEHVTVHPGAQAIVGDVHHHAPGVPGAGTRNEDRPHATTEAAPSAQGRAALLGPDAQGYGVPIPSDAQRPVPAPRRTVARRPRQPERPQARAIQSRDDRDPASASGDAS